MTHIFEVLEGDDRRGRLNVTVAAMTVRVHGGQTFERQSLDVWHGVADGVGTKRSEREAADGEVVLPAVEEEGVPAQQSLLGGREGGLEQVVLRHDELDGLRASHHDGGAAQHVRLEYISISGGHSCKRALL